MNATVEQAIVARVQKGDVRVPAFPKSARKLAEVLDRPDFSMEDIVKVLRSDDVLAATTLRMANSAFYARGSPTETVSAAVVRIGGKELHRLGVASGAARVFGSPGPFAGLRRRAWTQALLSAAICEQLATVADEPTEASFLAGLMHDIGRVLVIAVLEAVKTPMSDAEAWQYVERFHVELGMVLAARWKLPPSIETIISDHHARDAEPGEEVLRRVQASDTIVQMLEVEPTVTAERLGSVAMLSTAECRALAEAIPRMPEWMEAFSTEMPTDHAAVSVPLVPTTFTRPVELMAAGPVPVKGELLSGGPSELTVRTSAPGRANWLVQVKVEDLSFWANVRSTSPSAGGGHEWLMKPFALSPDVAAKWSQIVRCLDKAA